MCKMQVVVFYLTPTNKPTKHEARDDDHRYEQGTTPLLQPGPPGFC